MTTQKNNSERGQALVLMVLGIVVLLGFTALAVDGGMLYADRRSLQSAADAASLAGGGATASFLVDMDTSSFKCANLNNAINAAVAAAIERAAAHNFTITEAATGTNRVTVDCVDSGSNRYLDITTELSAETQTSFIHYVYQGAVSNTVTAVTRVKPKRPFASGYAIIALNDGTCTGSNKGGVTFNGGIKLDVYQGGIFTNGCVEKTGTSGWVHVHPTTAGIFYGTGTKGASYPVVDPAPVEAPSPMSPSELYIPPPTCSGPNHGSFSGTGTIQPGNYTSIRAQGSGDGIYLVPGGLYCITGGDFDMSNKDLGFDPTISNGKSGVTIYISANNGKFDTGGNGFVNIWAPPDDSNIVGPIPGVLFYLSGNGAVTGTGNARCMARLRGTSDSIFTGIVYAPGCEVNVGGNTSLESIDTQIIGWDVNLHGSSEANVNFKSSKLLGKPSMLELFK